MFEKLELTKMAQALARHSGARLSTIAANVANADTPGYRAMDLPQFADVYRASEQDVRTGRTLGAEARIEARPVAKSTGAAPNGNGVSLDIEMMKSIEARQGHETALAVYRSTSSMMRIALGRAG